MCVKKHVACSAVVTTVVSVCVEQQHDGGLVITEVTVIMPLTFTSPIKPYPLAVDHLFGLTSYFNQLMSSTMLQESPFLQVLSCRTPPN